MSQAFVQNHVSMITSPNEKPVSSFFTFILWWFQTFVFPLYFPGGKNRALIHYCPGKEAMGIIVVSLPCTLYHWASCPRYKLKIQIAGITKLLGCKQIVSLYLLAICSFPLAAQDTIIVKYKKPDSVSTNIKSTHQGTTYSETAYKSGLPNTLLSGSRGLTPRQVKSRVRFVAISNVVGYSAILAGLSTAWYSNYNRTGFHSFNDNREWLQIDKVGHMYGAYIESRTSMELWRWTGIERKKRIWYGGLSGIAYQTIIETLDGFSAGWGWSWGDIGANILGSGTMIAQELAWDDQRIKLKFSFHMKDYGNPQLNTRADKIYGKTLSERFIKDYNAHTFWASANLRSFLPKSNLPPWLAVAIGYGAEGMFGANENIGKAADGSINFDRRDIKRYRQWYLAPDIDLTKIKTNKKGVRFLFTVLSAFKFPAPGLELSNGKLKVKAVLF